MGNLEILSNKFLKEQDSRDTLDMLFQIQKPDPAGIYWLDTVLTIFFNNLFNNMAFGDGMFPPEFERRLE